MEAGLSARRLDAPDHTAPRPEVPSRVDMQIGDDAKKEHRKLSV